MCDIESKLMKCTLQLLANRKVKTTLKKISDDTGINLNWLQKFSNNKISNPSVNTIEKLYEYLSDKTLEV